MKTELIKQRLLRHRRQLVARYEDELVRAEEVAATGDPEYVERSTEDWDARVLTLLGDTDLRALEDVTRALRRLDVGEYGVCAECDDPISGARLAALPVASTCFACASEREGSMAVARSGR